MTDITTGTSVQIGKYDVQTGLRMIVLKTTTASNNGDVINVGTLVPGLGEIVFAVDNTAKDGSSASMNPVSFVNGGYTIALDTQVHNLNSAAGTLAANVGEAYREILIIST